MSPAKSGLATITDLATRARKAVTSLLDPRTDIDDPDPTRPYGRGRTYNGVELMQPYDDNPNVYVAYGHHVTPAHFVGAVAAALYAIGSTPADYRPLEAANVHKGWVRLVQGVDSYGTPYTEDVGALPGEKGAVAITSIEVEYI